MDGEVVRGEGPDVGGVLQDRWISYYISYRYYYGVHPTGEFPYKMFENGSNPAAPPTPVSQHPQTFLLIQLFFLFSSIIFIRVFLSLTDIIIDLCSR